ncbi:MAG TPA: phosphoglycerate dehydrogenase [Candidatus Limnocylindrales bacterium]|nr:phosphoglycerate dehydrogenase [Candidatus Limnocylindrales bacterium]
MKILVSDSLSPEGLEVLQQNAEVDYKPEISAAELTEIIGSYDALIVRSRSKVTAEVITAGKNLKVIGRAGVGVDNIDVEKATEKGIIVVNSPHGNTISAAEHAVALLTSLARNIAGANRSVKRGEWKRTEYTGVELNNKVLGLVGVGRIGSEVARRARAMGMKIIGYDPYVSSDQADKLKIEMVAFEELLKRSDFISLHLPLGSSTHHLIGAKEIAMLKPGVRIINCARGGLIDEDALYEALKGGRVAGAALDVFEQEPPVGCKLLELDNVIATPHLGALTQEAQVNVAMQVSEQVIKALRGEPIVSAVNVPALMPETRAVLEPFLPLLKVMGSFYMQMFGGSVDELEITYSGEIASMPLAPLTISCLIGFLYGIVGDGVNWVNAPYIARARGITVKESSISEVKNYSNLVTLTAKSGDRVHNVSGTLLNNAMRIVRVDDYRIEIIPTRYMLAITHNDRPGVVGKIGTLLGNEDVNIASMQLGRKKAGGEAMMVLQVDDHMTSEVVEKVRQLDVISSARFLVMPEYVFKGV